MLPPRLCYLHVSKHHKLVTCKDCRRIKTYWEYSKLWTSTKIKLLLISLYSSRRKFDKKLIQIPIFFISSLCYAAALGEQNLCININSRWTENFYCHLYAKSPQSLNFTTKFFCWLFKERLTLMLKDKCGKLIQRRNSLENIL